MKKIVVFMALILISSVAYAGDSYKITAIQIFTKDQIRGFAEYLGWSEEITECNGPCKTINNPQSDIDFVIKKFEEHSLEFTTLWANSIIEEQFKEQTKEVRPTLERQILEPIATGFTIEAKEE